VRTPGNFFRQEACGRKALWVLAKKPEMSVLIAPPKNPIPGASRYNSTMNGK
jgi:hypothetical protein